MKKVIEGALNTIKKCKPYIIIEIYDNLMKSLEMWKYMK